MFESFALRLAAGLVMALIVLPDKEVNPRFCRIHWLIATALLGAAGAFGWDTFPEWLWLPFGLSFGLCIVGFWCWAIEELRFARWAILIMTLCTLIGAMIPREGAWWDISRDLTAAAILGFATTAMLMGHWYLISPTMSLRPLRRLLLALFLAIAVRILAAGADFTLTTSTGALDQTAWLWLFLRWGAGLVAPAVLGWMAWESARIRSTQSATGILYVVVIFVFIGELTDQLFQAHVAEILG
jgi:hypothetical protein